MGAGGLGRRALAGLRRHGVEPLAFADNGSGRARTWTASRCCRPRPPRGSSAAARRSSSRSGAPTARIVSLTRASSCARSAATWSVRFRRCSGSTRTRSCRSIFRTCRPNVLDDRAEVRRAFDLWEDDASRAEYVAQVRFRLSRGLRRALAPGRAPAVLPRRSVRLVRRRVDRRWRRVRRRHASAPCRRVHGDRFGHVLALEPDPANFKQLRGDRRRASASRPRKVDCRQLALGVGADTLHLDATGTAASATSAAPSAGTIAVSAETLDSLVGRRAPDVHQARHRGLRDRCARRGARDHRAARAGPRRLRLPHAGPSLEDPVAAARSGATTTHSFCGRTTRKGGTSSATPFRARG